MSHDNGGGVASVALHVLAGSRDEVAPGTAFVLEGTAYNATQKRSALKFQRDVEDLGGSVASSAGRETFVYSGRFRTQRGRGRRTTSYGSISCAHSCASLFAAAAPSAGEVLRENAGALTGLLAEAATQPRLASWDLSESLPLLGARLEEVSSNPVVAIMEGLHAASYGPVSALGHSLYGLGDGVAGLEDVDTDAVTHFLASRFTGRTMVLSAVNVDHGALVGAAEKYLSAVNEGGPLPASPSPTVLGGNTFTRTREGSGLAHVGVSLEAPARGSPGYYAAGVLQALLGGTQPGGGGAGALRTGPQRQSRIARSIHTEAHSFIHSLRSFVLPYTDTGLLGLVGTAADHEAGRLVDAMAGFLKDAAAVPATAAELSRAKTAFKLALLLEAESRAGSRDSAGNALLLGGAVVPVSVALKAVDAVTAADVANVAKGALGSTPSIAAIGSLNTLPRYDVFASLFK